MILLARIEMFCCPGIYGAPCKATTVSVQPEHLSRAHQMINFLFMFQNWHQQIDVKKVVLPKMVKVLQSKSHLLSDIYPRLLPFLSKTPKENLVDFIGSILPSIRSGMETFVISHTSNRRNIRGNSQNGGSACVMAFFEVAFHFLAIFDEKEKENVSGLVSKDNYF